MSYPIKYLSLQKGELEYEVAVRGGTIGESVQELRKQIVKLAATLPPEDVLESHLEPKVDLEQVKVTLAKSKSNLDNLKINFDKNVYSRTETILNHVYFRIVRVNRTIDVTALYNECSEDFRLQTQELKNLKAQYTQAAFTSNSEPLADLITVSCEKKIVSDVIGKLKYSGKTCVRSFIQKAEELMVSRNISKDNLLNYAYEIFTDDALHWYRCIKDRVETWDDVVTLLKEDFSQSNYDYQLHSEIRMRTQGEQETISIYLSIMHGMFSRLSRPLSEEDKLEILLHNIRPCYASTLAASPNIASIDALKSLCRSYENIQSRMAQFHEPPKITSDTLAREFAYNGPSTSTSYKNHNYSYNRYDYNKKQYKTNQYYNYNQQNTNNTQKTTEQTKHININAMSNSVNQNSRKLYCPRCRNDTHSLGQCQQPHFPICFKCGKKGVRFPDCPECQTKSKSNTKN